MTNEEIMRAALGEIVLLREGAYPIDQDDVISVARTIGWGDAADIARRALAARGRRPTLYGENL